MRNRETYSPPHSATLAAKWAARLMAVLLLAQVLVVIVSWMINATMAPQTAVRSLLSSEGIRWFCGNFARMIASPAVAWILLLSIAYGLLRASRLMPSPADKKTPHPTSFGRTRRGVRKSVALITVVAEFVVIVAIMLILCWSPHAILRSATGGLFPSSFSASLIPIVACSVSIMSCTYGAIVGTLPSLYEAYRAACRGIAAAAPLLLLYIAAAQLYFSLVYLMGEGC